MDPTHTNIAGSAGPGDSLTLAFTHNIAEYSSTILGWEKNKYVCSPFCNIAVNRGEDHQRMFPLFTHFWLVGQVSGNGQ